jgi:cytochrome b involved in lipid metabolism
MSEMAFRKRFSPEEVAKHNKEDDLWVIIDAKVYDLSKFAPLHPGGSTVLLDEGVGSRCCFLTQCFQY